MTGDLADRLALAILTGAASIEDVRDELRQALREREVTASANALRAYRDGKSVWSWPKTAPWAGF